VEPADVASIGYGPKTCAGDRVRSGTFVSPAGLVLSELLGRDRLVHLDVGGERIRIRISADLPTAGEMTVHVESERPPFLRPRRHPARSLVPARHDKDPT
jgi:hypothetical protein